MIFQLAGIDPLQLTMTSMAITVIALPIVVWPLLVVMNDRHLRRLLREYVEYYNAERVHTSITDAPAGRASELRRSGTAKVIRLPRVGGLHGRYTWRDAA